MRASVNRGAGREARRGPQSEAQRSPRDISATTTIRQTINQPNTRGATVKNASPLILRMRSLPATQTRMPAHRRPRPTRRVTAAGTNGGLPINHRKSGKVPAVAKAVRSMKTERFHAVVLTETPIHRGGTASRTASSALSTRWRRSRVSFRDWSRLSLRRPGNAATTLHSSPLATAISASGTITTSRVAMPVANSPTARSHAVIALQLATTTARSFTALDRTLSATVSSAGAPSELATKSVNVEPTRARAVADTLWLDGRR